jgi:hypothetical protein
MMLRGLIVTFVAAALAAPAAAQTDHDAFALTALRNYAACAVARTPEGAAKLLALDLGSDEYAKALKHYAKGHSYCAPQARLKFGGLPFAGDLAEALIAQRFAGRSLEAVAAKVSEPAATSLIVAIGECMVRQRPAAVSAVLATEPGSATELAALKPTGDVLPQCIPAGQTMALNKPAVRAIYALGAYSLLTQASDG